MDSNEHKAFMVDVNINQVPVSMEYDTGAALTLITKKIYGTYTEQFVPLLGATSVNMEYDEKQDVLQVLVVEGEAKHFG